MGGSSWARALDPAPYVATVRHRGRRGTTTTGWSPTRTSTTSTAEQAVTIEITGLSLYTHHGVGAAEREVGQRLVFDLSFEVGECDATVTDRVEDTVDYADVCQQVAI